MIFFSVDRCAFCDTPIAGGQACAGCLRDLPWNDPACDRCALPLRAPGQCPACQAQPSAFDAAWTAFRFTEPIDGMVREMKYRSGLRQARLLGTLMAQRLVARTAPLPDVILPVPLHWQRLMRRGYNQSLELARALTARIAMSVDRQVRRTRATQDQIGKTAAQRRRNVQGAFAVHSGLAGQHVALLDDVITTGATLAELAGACRKAGARRIEAWAVARVE